MTKGTLMRIDAGLTVCSYLIMAVLVVVLAGCESMDFEAGASAAATEAGAAIQDGSLDQADLINIGVGAVLGLFGVGQTVRAAMIKRNARSLGDAASDLVESVQRVRFEADVRPLTRADITQILDDRQTPAAKTVVRKVKAGSRLA